MVGRVFASINGFEVDVLNVADRKSVNMRDSDPIVFPVEDQVYANTKDYGVIVRSVLPRDYISAIER